MTPPRAPRLLPWLAAAVMLAAACAPQKTVRKGPLTGTEATGTKLQPEADTSETKLATGTEVDEASIRGKEFVPVGDLKVVHFEYDAYSLAEDARGVLRSNAEYLKGHPDLEVLVEGHCDERGTTEYNLALGQKRAKSVRDYYIRLGVPGKKIATLSFGKERPGCKESTETCWAENRRAETKIRAEVSSATIPSGQTQYH